MSTIADIQCLSLRTLDVCMCIVRVCYHHIVRVCYHHIVHVCYHHIVRVLYLCGYSMSIFMHILYMQWGTLEGCHCASSLCHHGMHACAGEHGVAIGGSGERPSAGAESSHWRERRAAIGGSGERPLAEAEKGHWQKRRKAIGRSGERPLAEAERERKRAAPRAVCCGTALCVNGEDARPRCLRGTGGARSTYRMGSMANV